MGIFFTQHRYVPILVSRYRLQRIGASIAQIASLLPDVGPADQRPVILEKAICK